MTAKDDKNKNKDSIRCKDCKYWDSNSDEWNGTKSCRNYEGHFFVGGGDNTDGFNTEAMFGCVDGKRRT